MERENLAGDGKGKGASGSNREAESTDAPERGGLPRSSFYALMAGSLFIFRRKLPDKERPFRTPFYPWLPAAFLLSSLVLLADTLRNTPKESGIGVGLIALGIPGFYLFRWLTTGPGPNKS
jgi:hypothetical protein